ncbi:RAB6-interacting golgin isoform X2 [Anabrus simplex]|uniref:RAB6-interacting golgin isoform X2 n=1 Tax=Anabrus simplex TaxID=316456 RepID=UPI0035A313CF
MAVQWDGFTEDDIKKLSVTECLVEGQQSHKPVAEIRVAKRQAGLLKGSGKKNVARERMLQKAPPTSTVTDATSDDIPESARLSKPKAPDVQNTSEKLPLMSEGSSDSGCAVSNGGPSPESSKTSSADASPSHGPVFLRIKEGKNYEVVGSDKTSLDEFQTRHKMMEEQNRRRKELLAKALANRKKQTHEEARRLQQIQEELQKLDVRLSNDVGILRNQIEAASFEFMEAQKRYDKAEKEFLEAKLCLFGKLERKELLTEHLCTIIEQNEMRKARKLSELMDKLQLGTSIELSEEEQKHATAGAALLSPLCALDEVSYSACNTLKNRQKETESRTAEEQIPVRDDASERDSEPDPPAEAAVEQPNTAEQPATQERSMPADGDKEICLEAG